MRLRAYLYRIGVFSSKKVRVPVVSVGNLTMGGTAKTPMVIYICRLLGQRLRTAVLSRGYGGSSREAVNVVSTGEGPLLSPELAGDEPCLLAKKLPGTMVLTGPKRVVTAAHAVERLGAEAIVLDDGFQHLALRRDVDIVLFAAAAPLADGWVCPGGLLREPFAALRRASVFVITGVEADCLEQARRFKKMLLEHFPKTPVFFGRYGVDSVSLVDSHDDLIPPERRNFFAFCGIARPGSFFHTLEQEGLTVGGQRSFRDHKKFQPDDLRALEAEAGALGCDALITTEKDYVKLAALRVNLPLYVVQVSLKMSPEFDRLLLDLVNPAQPCA